MFDMFDNLYEVDTVEGIILKRKWIVKIPPAYRLGQKAPPSLLSPVQDITNPPPLCPIFNGPLSQIRIQKKNFCGSSEEISQRAVQLNHVLTRRRLLRYQQWRTPSRSSKAKCSPEEPSWTRMFTSFKSL